MFALQLGFDDNHILLNGVDVGKCKLAEKETLEVLRLYTEEYHQLLRLIKEEIDGLKLHNIVYCSTEGGCVLIRQRVKTSIDDVIQSAIYPMQSSAVVVSFSSCNKTWIIKPSVSRVKSELRQQGVIV